MKRSSLRAFGLACFIIGALLTVSDQFNIPILPSPDNHSLAQYEKKIEELEQQLHKANEKLSKVEETPAASTSVEEKKKPPIDKEESKETTNQQEATKVEEQEEIVTGTLYIYSGLTSYEVAEKIKELGVIKNSVEMELFLAQPEYSRAIQKGQFELNSSMTVEEIANIITGKPNN